MLENRQFRSVYGIASVIGFEVQIELGQYFGWVGQHLGSNSIGQYFGSKLRLKSTGFEIEVGLTGIET